MEPIERFMRDAHFEKGVFVEKQEMRIFYHDDIESPRSPDEFDNLSHMVCFHGRHALGDKDHGIDMNRFSSWVALEQYLIHEMGAHLIYPLSIYDHSGITIFIGTPNDPWDSVQVGFVYVTKQDIIDEYGEVTPITEAIAKRVIEGEVEIYDRYLQGMVYGYEIYENDEFYDSCWGFYCNPDEIADEIWGKGAYHEL